MLAVRPAPTDRRMIRLAAPLLASTRYLVTVTGVRGLTGVTGRESHSSLTVPKPAPPRTPTAKPDTTAAHRDSTAAHGDSTPHAPRPDALPARRDSGPPTPNPHPTPPR